MQVYSSLSGIPFYAPSAGYAPTNSADVSAIASAYQVVSATATQLYAGTAYVTSINDAPVSAARAGNAANASIANSAYYDGTGRLISALPDSATVSAIASSYAESAASSKLDSSASSSFYPADNPSGFISSVDLSDYATTAYVDSSISGFAYESAVSAWTAKQDQLTFGYNTANQISSIDGSALGGMDDAAVSAIASAYAESAVSAASSNYYTTANESGYALSSDVSATVDLVGTQSANWGGSALALSAGPGVKLMKVGNTLVASTDETVLWSGSEWVSATPTISLSGSVSSYDRIGIYAGGYGDTKQQDFKMIHLSAEDSSNGAPLNIQGVAGDYTTVRFNVGLVFPSANGSALRFVGFRQFNVGTSVATAQTPAKVRKIVGINRTAEA